MSDIQDYFEYILEKHGEKTVNPSIKIYPNKIETRIIFKIGYHLEVLASEEIKLLGSTKSKITKDKNGENVLYLENTKVALKTCNLLIKVINKIQEFCFKAIQKTAQSTGDLIGNKIANKIARVSKTLPQNSSEINEEILRQKYISPKKLLTI